jgi:hypothetical protein
MPAIVIYGLYAETSLSRQFRRSLRQQLIAVINYPPEKLGIYLVTERVPENGQLIFAEVKGFLDPEETMLAMTVTRQAIADLQTASKDEDPIKRVTAEVVTDEPSHRPRTSNQPN